MPLFIVKEPTTGLYLSGTGKFPPLSESPHVYSSVRAARGAISNMLGGPGRKLFHYRRVPHSFPDYIENPQFIIQEITFQVVAEYEPVSKAY